MDPIEAFSARMSSVGRSAVLLPALRVPIGFLFTGQEDTAQARRRGLRMRWLVEVAVLRYPITRPTGTAPARHAVMPGLLFRPCLHRVQRSGAVAAAWLSWKNRYPLPAAGFDALWALEGAGDPELRVPLDGDLEKASFARTLDETITVLGGATDERTLGLPQVAYDRRVLRRVLHELPMLLLLAPGHLGARIPALPRHVAAPHVAAEHIDEVDDQRWIERRGARAAASLPESEVDLYHAFPSEVRSDRGRYSRLNFVTSLAVGHSETWRPDWTDAKERIRHAAESWREEVRLRHWTTKVVGLTDLTHVETELEAEEHARNQYGAAPWLAQFLCDQLVSDSLRLLEKGPRTQFAPSAFLRGWPEAAGSQPFTMFWFRPHDQTDETIARLRADGARLEGEEGRAAVLCAGFAPREQIEAVLGDRGLDGTAVDVVVVPVR